MTFGSILLALIVAFPKPGMRLPNVEATYLTGATDPGVTNVVVNGQNVKPHPLGGFVTMVEVVEGENEIAISDGRHATNLFVVVAEKPQKQFDKNVEPRVYKKLAYSSEVPRTNRLGTVYLDAGHGGSENGAYSPHGLEEKDANLRMTRAVADELRKLGVAVKLTRSDDSKVELYERARAAHADCNAAAFVSIHHNAPPCNKDPRTMRYHAVYAWNDIGKDLAKQINEEMATAFGDTLVNNGVVSANFAVTRSPELPSCLIEVDFITTPEGEIDCWNPVRRRKIAAAIAKGIVRWRDESH